MLFCSGHRRPVSPDMSCPLLPSAEAPPGHLEVGFDVSVYRQSVPEVPSVLWFPREFVGL